MFVIGVVSRLRLTHMLIPSHTKSSSSGMDRFGCLSNNFAGFGWAWARGTTLIGEYDGFIQS
jgi:hypothetical protein